MNRIYYILIIAVVLVTSCTVRTVEENPPEKQVEISAEHQICGTDSDCTYVRTKCNSCECYGAPVNKEFKQGYETIFDETCKGFQGPVCDVKCAAGEFKCIDGRCAFSEATVTEEQLDDCSEDFECMVVPFKSCCGATKKAINQKYIDNYNNNPQWQEFDDPETCAVIGVCADDSEVTSAKCQENKCRLVY